MVRIRPMLPPPPPRATWPEGESVEHDKHVRSRSDYKHKLPAVCREHRGGRMFCDRSSRRQGMRYHPQKNSRQTPLLARRTAAPPIETGVPARLFQKCDEPLVDTYGWCARTTLFATLRAKVTNQLAILTSRSVGEIGGLLERVAAARCSPGEGTNVPQEKTNVSPASLASWLSCNSSVSYSRSSISQRDQERTHTTCPPSSCR